MFNYNDGINLFFQKPCIYKFQDLPLLLTKKQNMAFNKGWSHNKSSPTLWVCIDHMGIGFMVLFTESKLSL